MKKRRLLLGAFTVASCSPIAAPPDAGLDAGADAGTDAGTDAGYDAGAPDSGVPDGGRDAGPRSDGGPVDSGCPCYRADGGCPVPPDFPPDAAGTFYEQELCYCEPNTVVWCADETTYRCESWGCNPGKETDGGLQRQADGGVICYC